ncbi:MAG: hypothetical protein IJV84_02425 [Bacteroidales bacterium]|nr:hypothetical protein [Bacteroidales bacterium]MBQ8049463.1 hypothetical protein [Bacteroidales bacterium]MBQ8810297.1 hypothetical protein [Bacteroidales bacterium]MBQ9722355.1 hypothetical protein [Bacteroidales bacterium]
MSKKNLITACVIFTVLAVFWGWTGCMTYMRAGEFTFRVILALICAVLSAVVPFVYYKEYRKNQEK